MFDLKEILRFWKSQDAFTKYLIISVLSLVVFAYLPTLQFDYVTQDQWRAFRYSSSEQSSFERLTKCTSTLPSFYILTGRPFVWPTECLEHAFVDKISDFKYLRPLSLAVVVFTVIYLSSIINKFTGGVVTALVVSAVFITAPAYSFMYLQGLPALMVLISIVLAAASYKHYTESLTSDSGRYKHSIYSSLLFLTACMIYPAFAFIVLPLALMKFASSDADSVAQKLKELSLTLAFYGLMSGIYYLFVKIYVILTPAINDLPNLGLYEVSAQLSPSVIFERISRVVNYFFMMPPMNFPTFHGVSFAVLVAFSVVLGLTSLRSNHENRYLTASFLVGVAFFVSCVVLLSSTAPWLFSKMDELSTRHLLAFYLFISFAAVFALKAALQSVFKLSDYKVSLAIVMLVLVPISVIQNGNSFLEIASTRAEIEMLRSKINQWAKNGGLSGNRFILIVRPTSTRPTSINNLLNDDGYGNDNAVLASSQNPVSIPWMVNAIFREEFRDRKINVVDCGFDTESCVSSAIENPKNIVVAYSYDNRTSKQDFITCSIQPYVINISELSPKPINPIIKIVESPSISATSTLDYFGPQGLFMALAPGWHAKRNPEYPQVLNIDLKEKKSIGSISFLPQSSTFIARSPKSVRIKTSNNGQLWHTVANGDDMCSANSPGGWHKFNLPNKVEARYLEIAIISNCGDPDFLTLRGLKIE